MSVLQLVASTVHVLSRIKFPRNIMAESASSWLPKHISDVVEEDKLHLKTSLGETIFKNCLPFSSTGSPPLLLVCVWRLALGLRSGRRFPVIPFMQQKSKPKQLIQREAHP